MKVIQLIDRFNAFDPVAHRESSLVTLLGVTIAFAAGSLAIIAFLLGLSVLEVDGRIIAGNPHLFEQSLLLIGYAIFAGALVDTLRLLGDLFWRQ